MLQCVASWRSRPDADRNASCGCLRFAAVGRGLDLQNVLPRLDAFEGQTQREAVAARWPERCTGGALLGGQANDLSIGIHEARCYFDDVRRILPCAPGVVVDLGEERQRVIG